MAPTSTTGQDKTRLAMAATGVGLLVLALWTMSSRVESAGAAPAPESFGAPAASTLPTAEKAEAGTHADHDHADHDADHSEPEGCHDDHDAHEGHDHGKDAEASKPAIRATLVGTSPLEPVTATSRLLVLELSGHSVRLLEAVTKDLPYRKSQRAKFGAWQLVLLDADGAALDAIPFEAAGLCPLAGEGHDKDHVSGHMVLEHKTSVMVRIPDLGARTAELRRRLPELDETPKTLGRFTLPPSKQ